MHYEQENKPADILVGNNWLAVITVAITIKKKKKRSNISIVISSQCITAVCDLGQHYLVEIQAVTMQVSTCAHNLLHGSIRK